MTGRAIQVLETALRVRNRVARIGWYAQPSAYFDADGLAGAEARCEAANRDLLGFIRPPETVPATNVSARVIGRSRGQRVVEVRFDSPLPSGRAENDRVQLVVWMPPDTGPGRPALLFHHPLFQRRWRKWEWFLAPFLARMPVAAMAAPYHMGRTPAGEFPGESSVNPNPWRLFQAIRQWTWDQAAASRILEERFGLRPAAVLGFSLGAFQSLLAASAGVLTLPVVSVACTNRYAFGVRHGVLSAGLRDGFHRAGIDAARLEHMVRSLELERHVAPLHGRPVLHVRGLHDFVDPPPSGERLEAALQPLRALRLHAGHSSQALFRKTIAAESWRLLADCGIIATTERPERPPPGGPEAATRFP
jgi:pimeloyl-ACP methyl ester carboxylesterase